MEVRYDPDRITYEQLLDFFWRAFPQDLPPGPPRTRMAVFVRDPTERALAIASARRFGRASGRAPTTAIVPGARFVAAEERLQKFHLQRRFPRLVEHLAVRYGSRAAALESPAAERLDAWAGGFDQAALPDGLLREIGLDRGELERLTARAAAPALGAACPTAAGLSAPSGALAAATGGG